MATQPTLKDYIGIAPSSGLALAELVERGLPTKNLELLKAKGLTFTEMANTVISPRTLKHRKARGENLSPEETERAVRVASIIALAEHCLLYTSIVANRASKPTPNRNSRN